MNTKKYENMKQALEDSIRKDRDYILIRHTLEKNDEIKLHYHKLANEWVILDSGSVRVQIGKKEKEIRPKKGEIISLKFPRLSKHSLVAKSKITYFVLRDRKDKTIYAKN